MPDLSVSLGGDISAFERAMQTAGQLAGRYSRQIEVYFGQAAQRIDQQFGTSLQSAVGLDKVLSSLRVAGGLVLGFEVIREAIDLTTRAAEEAAKELQHLVDVGNKARDAGVSATFFQGFTGQAKQLGTEVSTLEAVLTQARSAFQTNIGEGDKSASSTAADRVKQNVLAGNLSPSASNDLASAETLQDKYRVALGLLDQLKGKGAELAEFDLAGKFFGPDFELRLRSGVDVIGAMRSALDGVAATAQGRVATEQEIATAQRIQAEYADQDRRIAEAWAPVEALIAQYQQDQLKSMADLREYYVDVVTAAGHLVGWLSQASAYLSSMGNAPFFQRMVTLMNEYGLITDPDIKRQLDQGHADPDPNAARPLTVRPRPDTSRSLPSLTPPSAGRSAVAKQTDEVENLIKSLAKATAAEQGEAAAVGLSNKVKQESIDIAKAEEAAKERGRALTSAERQQIIGLADSYSAAKQRIDDFAKAQEALKQGLDEVRYAAKGVLSGFIEDLRNGKGFGQAFADVLGSIESKVLSLAENSVIDELFGKQGSTGAGAGSGLFGGLLSTLVSGLGGTYQGAFAHYATGGLVRGQGSGTSDSVPAYLSSGEYVVPARVAAEHRDMLDAITSGAPARMIAAASRPVAPVTRGGGSNSYTRNNTVNMNVATQDAGSFLRSEGQIGALLARAAARGQRNA